MSTAKRSTKARVAQAITGAALTVGLALTLAPPASAGPGDGFVTAKGKNSVACIVNAGVLAGLHRSKGAVVTVEKCTYKSNWGQYTARVGFDY